jgi:hypothetical protein
VTWGLAAFCAALVFLGFQLFGLCRALWDLLEPERHRMFHVKH